ncbi:hypothetical protein [Anaeromyxobacter sp. PSR-1]|uniref:hypothetical protein n=1 Tax=Anaeromyxobacter sp. PSR-1 TaxID=1300915 RepID=UPI00126A568A|nr:hypothetical protein [Anaeromyxobacter sp. PSR-1]
MRTQLATFRTVREAMGVPSRCEGCSRRAMSQSRRATSPSSVARSAIAREPNCGRKCVRIAARSAFHCHGRIFCRSGNHVSSKKRSTVSEPGGARRPAVARARRSSSSAVAFASASSFVLLEARCSRPCESTQHIHQKLLRG